MKSSGQTVKKAGTIELPEYRPGKAGDLAMLLGIQSTNMEWGVPIEVTKASFDYITKAPGPKEPTQKRLAYFLNYLEFPDDLVANDAYGEFATAPFVEIRKLKEDLPRERITKWVQNPKTTVSRLGLYGLLLGLCGNEDDAKIMADRITEPSQDYRIGVDGIMAGYVLLKGEDGLKLLEDTKLKAGVKVPFSETYAAMQAIRFSWNYNSNIKKDRLKLAMRLLLDRPALADLVIADLARWKDWDMQEKLMKMYDDEEYDIPSIKRAIARFLLVCSKDKTANKHAALARKNLQALRDQDPDTIEKVERFFFVN